MAQGSLGVAAQEVDPAVAAESLVPIVVTATRSARPINETPVASHIVTAADMDGRNIKTLDDTLNSIPGVFVNRGKGYMDTLSEIILRGVPGGKRSLIMVDGLPINDAYDNSARLGGFAPEDLDRVEVALGPASSLYGSSAMGGVVNFITRMPEGEEYRFRIGYGGRLRSDSGLANLRRAYFSAGNSWDSGLSLIASVSGTATHGYVSDLVTSSVAPGPGVGGATASQTTSGSRNYIIGDRGSNAWRDHDISLRGEFETGSNTILSASFFRTSYRYDYHDYQTYLRDAAGAPVWDYGSGLCGISKVCESGFLPGQGKYTRTIYKLGLDTRVGNSDLQIQAGVIDSGTNWYTSVSSTSMTAKLDGGAIANGYSQSPSRVANLDATVSTPVLDRHTLLWGMTWRRERADSSEYDLADWQNPGSRTWRVADSGGRTSTVGAFAQLELELADGLQAFLGARYDRWHASNGYANNYAAGGFSQSYANKTVGSVSPRIGLVWVANQAVTLRASAGKAFRAPGIYDLYRTWKSSTTIYAGGPDLTPETLKSYEVGGDFKPWRGADLKLTYFNNDFSNMIYRRTVTGDAERVSVCGSVTLACQVWDNVAKARSRGVEIALDQRIDSNWKAAAGFTYNDTRIKSNPANPLLVGKKFTRVPRLMASLDLDWQQGNWSASGHLRYVSKRYSTDMNTDIVNNVPGSYDPYTLVDFKLGYQINRHLKAALSVDNVFSRRYFSSYRAPGRTWFFELSGDF